MNIPRSLKGKLDARDRRGFIKEARRRADATRDKALSRFLKFLIASASGAPIGRQVQELPGLVRVCGTDVPEDLEWYAQHPFFRDMRIIIWLAWCMVDRFDAGFRDAVLAHAASPADFECALDALESSSLRGVLSRCIAYAATGDVREITCCLERLDHALCNAAETGTELSHPHRVRIQACLATLLGIDGAAGYRIHALRALARLGYSDFLRSELLDALSDAPENQVLSVAEVSCDVGLTADLLLAACGAEEAIGFLMQRLRDKPELIPLLAKRWGRLGGPLLLCAWTEGLTGTDRAARLLDEAVEEHNSCSVIVESLSAGAEEGWAPPAAATLLGLALSARFRDTIDMDRLRKAVRASAESDATERAALMIVDVLPPADPRVELVVEFLAKTTPPAEIGEVQARLGQGSPAAAVAFLTQADGDHEPGRVVRLVKALAAVDDEGLEPCLRPLILAGHLKMPLLARVISDSLRGTASVRMRVLARVIGALSEHVGLEIVCHCDVATFLAEEEPSLAEWPSLRAAVLAKAGHADVAGRVLQAAVSRIGVAKAEEILHRAGLGEPALQAEMTLIALAADDEAAVLYAKTVARAGADHARGLIARMRFDADAADSVPLRTYAKLVGVADPEDALAFSHRSELTSRDRGELLEAAARATSRTVTVVRATRGLEDPVLVAEVIEHAFRRGLAGESMVDALGARASEISTCDAHLAFGRAYAAAGRPTQAAEQFMLALERSPDTAPVVIDAILGIDERGSGALETALFQGLIAVGRNDEAMHLLRAHGDAVDVRVADQALDRWQRNESLPPDLSLIRLERKLERHEWRGALEALRAVGKSERHRAARALATADLAGATEDLLMEAVDVLWNVDLRTEALDAACHVATKRGATRLRKWLCERLDSIEESEEVKRAVEVCTLSGDSATALILIGRMSRTELADGWEELVDALLHQDPDNAQIWRIKAELATPRCKPDAVLHALNYALRGGALTADEWRDRAERLLLQHPSCGAARTALCEHYLQVEDVGSACALVDSGDGEAQSAVLELIESFAGRLAGGFEYCFALAELYGHLPGRERQEAEWLDRSLELCANGDRPTTLLVRRGTLALRVGDAAGCAAHFREAARRGGLRLANIEQLRVHLAAQRAKERDCGGTLVRALSLAECGEYVAALDELRSATAEHDSKRANAALYVRGVCLESIGKALAAARVYGVVVKQAGDEPGTLAGSASARLARCARQLGLHVGDSKKPDWTVLLEPADSPMDLGPLPFRLPAPVNLPAAEINP